MSSYVHKHICRWAAQPGVRLLGSVKLAMVLLAIVILACIVGTIAESRLDTTVAQAYVYDAPWFLAWLLVLCANLACSVLVRFPWKRHQAGFIVTHAGIIILLAGAMAGRVWGLEGNITLYKGDQPRASLVLNRTVLQVQTEQMSQPAIHPVDLRLHAPSPARPARWSLGATEVRVLDYSEALGMVSSVEENGDRGPAAVKLQIRSGMVSKPIDTWLVEGEPGRDQFNLGAAVLSFGRAPGAEGDGCGMQHGPGALGGQAGESTGLRERHFVFAKHPGMNSVRALVGSGSGIRPTFVAEAAQDSKGTLRLKLDGNEIEFALGEILDKATPIPGTGFRLEKVKYLPDFRLNGKEAVSASDEPRNPALVFEIAGNGTACNHGNEASQSRSTSMGGCCPSDAKEKSESLQSGVTFFLDAGQLHYRSISKGKAVGDGAVEIGKAFPTGLADWSVTIEKLVRHSRFAEELAPVANVGGASKLVSGVLVQLERAGASTKRWVPWGNPAQLLLANEQVQVTFGYEVHPLSFALVLDEFEVELNEGTQTPAGFKSHVRFIDPKAQKSVAREIWMNHPATFPERSGSSLLGTGYKFSQASWNPNDLGQTTLQVLRDPGWSMKWMGSLLLCAGLFAMFYLKPNGRRTLLNDL